MNLSSKRFEENRFFLTTQLIFLICVIGVWLAYCLYGPSFTQTIVEYAQAFSLLRGQNQHPVAYYISLMDSFLPRYCWALITIGSLPFILGGILEVICGYILRKKFPESFFKSVCAGSWAAFAVVMISNIFLQTQVWTQEFISMSLNPFAEGALKFRFRIMGPLLGWLTQLNGDHYWILALIVLTVFLIALHYWAQLIYKNSMAAALITLMISFTPAAMFHAVYWWNDGFAYLFLILALLNRKGMPLFILAGLLSHEFFLAYIPFIFLYHFLLSPDRAQIRKEKWFLMGLGIMTSLAVYLVLRKYLNSLGGSIFNESFYRDVFRTRGISAAFKQPLLLGFLTAHEMSLGLLFFAAPYFFTEKIDISSVIVLGASLLPLGLLVIAFDTTRFIANIFPFFVMLPRFIPEKNRNRLLLAFALANFFVPTFFMTCSWHAPLNKSAKIIYALWS